MYAAQRAGTSWKNLNRAFKIFSMSQDDRLNADLKAPCTMHHGGNSEWVFSEL